MKTDPYNFGGERGEGIGPDGGVVQGPIGWGKAVRLAAWLLSATVKVAIGPSAPIHGERLLPRPRCPALKSGVEGENR